MKKSKWRNRIGRRRVVLNFDECRILHELMHDYCAKKVPELETKVNEASAPWEKEKYMEEIKELNLLKSKVSPG